MGLHHLVTQHSQDLKSSLKEKVYKKIKKISIPFFPSTFFEMIFRLSL